MSASTASRTVRKPRRIALLALGTALLALAAAGVTLAARTAGPNGRIAVVSDGGLSIVSAVTGARREVATVVMSAPAWSPDGRELSYVAEGAFDGRMALRTKTLGSGRVRTIAHIPDGLSPGPAWSPRGDRLAYTVDWSARGGLFVVGSDGRGRRRVASRDVAAYQVPRWSPDGRRIAFRTDRADGTQSIWTVKPNGRGLTLVRRGALDYPDSVAWSPDSRRIAFVGLPTGRTDGAALVVTSATGASPRSVAAMAATSDDASVGNVSWSPRGTRIAYVRWNLDEVGDRASSELCVADPEHGGTRVLARSHSIDELAWSRDGQWLAYLVNDSAAEGRSRTNRIWVIRADGTGNHPVARFAGEETTGLDWGPAAR